MPDKQRVELTTTLTQTVERCAYFCPSCGKKEVWAEIVNGPHTGLYCCTACNESWRMNVWIEDRIDTHAVRKLSERKT